MSGVPDDKSAATGLLDGRDLALTRLTGEKSESSPVQLNPLIINAIRDTFSKNEKVLKVILFGSYATGAATPDSDVDLLVVIDNSIEASLDETVKARSALRAALKNVNKRIAFDLILATHLNYEKYKLSKAP